MASGAVAALVAATLIGLATSMGYAGPKLNGTLSLTPAAGAPGAVIKVVGRIAPKVKHKVRLQRRDGAKFVTIATTKTSKVGRFRFRTTLPAHGTTAVYRVVSLKVRDPRTGRRTSYRTRTRRASIVTPTVVTTPTPTPTPTPVPPAPGSTTRVSLAGDGTQPTADSRNSAISADGRFVTFETAAPNLVPGDTNGQGDVFVRDLATGTTSRVSIRSDGTQASGTSYDPSISADGRYVAFQSYAALFPGDTNGKADVYVHDRTARSTSLVSLDSAGALANEDSRRPAISGDGRFVTYESWATNLVPGDTNRAYDVFVHDRSTAVTTRVSVATGGAQASGSEPAISGDGRYVTFQSSAASLLPGASSGAPVFVHDRSTGVTRPVSVAIDGTPSGASHSSISADGRFVAFESPESTLVPGDTHGPGDVFVRDLTTGVTTRVSVATGGAQANESSWKPAISSDGRFVTFESWASNLVPGDTYDQDVFVHDRSTGVTRLASVGSAGPGPGGSSYNPSVSADGRRVAFHSAATNLVSGDTNGVLDVFVWDRGQ
ncbi:PD40 domain-containing protein [Nocardioides sp. 616]|uniref:TolB family protein n=1 Tax=Nocardioides sp. 616 TaxID=2268090 RepID=UPI000CE397CA|nr:PD40 domain-containing protein [Nocardioides sp. 616]